MQTEFEEWVTTPSVQDFLRNTPEFSYQYRNWGLQLSAKSFNKAWEIQQEKIDKLEAKIDQQNKEWVM